MSKENTCKVKKIHNEALEKQLETVHCKEQIKLEKQIGESKEDYIDGLYLIDQYNCVQINLIGWRTKYDDSILVSECKEEVCHRPNKGDHNT
eukprot:9650744-Ditylum_brightwellii.AAC.1